MKLRASLVNAPWEDPGVFVDLEGEGEAFLLDCGSLHALRARDVMRVVRVFLSHAHIDHFIGFDHLLRMRLGIGGTVTVYGPPGVTAHVRGKLAGYVWNLVQDSTLVFRVAELAADRVAWTAFPCCERFAEHREEEEAHEGWLPLPEGGRVRFAPVDHGVECLAWALEEAPAHRVDPEALRALGVPAGRWVSALKEKAAAGDRSGTLDVGGTDMPVAALLDRLVRPQPGRRIAYVTDTAFNRTSVGALRAIARGADELWCEAAYLHEELEKARAHRHMTARQAGRLAAELEVARLHLFHFSRRYQPTSRDPGREGGAAHLAEARAVFPATVPAPQYGRVPPPRAAGGGVAQGGEDAEAGPDAAGPPPPS